MMKFLLLLVAICAVVLAQKPKKEVIKPKLPTVDTRAGAKPPNGIGAQIVGGTNVVLGQIPYQAFILGDGTNLCGGTLISNTYVVTSAACVSGRTSFKVCVGTLDWTNPSSTTGSQCFTSQSAIVFPGYNPSTAENNIGLIKLPSAVQTSNTIKVARLPKLSDLVNGVTYAAQQATASGWGKTSDTSGASQFLKFAQMPVITNSVCTSYKYYTPTINSQLCTSGTGGKSICYGDNGGPLTILETDGKPTLIGIASHVGFAGCASGYPQVFTRVTYFMQWIASNAGVTLRP
ncbi:brachyurin-like isoform X2 [Neocloeon triangulifer]|nr:brachyurin-like isoform X2 [Neocloeon triangulifer]